MSYYSRIVGSKGAVRMTNIVASDQIALLGADQCALRSTLAVSTMFAHTLLSKNLGFSNCNSFPMCTV